MYADSRKIHIIEAIIKTDDEKILSKIEETISDFEKPKPKFSARDFVGTLSREDAALMEKAIEEGCEQINPDDWKEIFT